MNINLVDGLLKATNIGDLNNLDHLFIQDAFNYIKTSVSNDDTNKDILIDDASKIIKELINDKIIKQGFSEWQQIKRFVIDYIIREEKFLDRLESIYYLSINPLYESVFGRPFDYIYYNKLIHESINFNDLLNLNYKYYNILNKQTSYGVYIINGIPKSGKQLFQLFLMDSCIKNKKSILNIVCGERPDTILQSFYKSFYNKYKSIINERIVSSSIIGLLSIIAKSKSDIVFVNSINSIIDINSSGIITKGGLDKNSMEMITRLINYVAILSKKIIFLVYRSQPNDDSEQIKSIYSGMTNGVITLPNSKLDSGAFDSDIKFDNRTPGIYDEEKVVISFNEIRNLIDPLLLRGV